MKIVSMLWRVSILVTLCFLSSHLYSQTDTTSPINDSFTLAIHAGEPQKILNNNVSLLVSVNMFGRSEISFDGIVGVELEPTGEYKRNTVGNIGRGDNIYMKENDSTIYLLHIAAVRSNIVEINFKRLQAAEPLPDRDQLKEMGYATEPMKRQFTIYAGAIFPGGDFQDVNLNKPSSGFAETGTGVGVSYSQQLSGHFEAGGFALYSHNSLNEEFLDNAIYYIQPGAKIDSKGWDIIWLIGEGGYTCKVLETMDFYLHGNLGMISVYAPDITAFYSNIAYTYLSGTAIAAAYGGSLGFRESEKINVGMRWLTARAALSKGQASSTNVITTLQFTAGYIF